VSAADELDAETVLAINDTELGRALWAAFERLAQEDGDAAS
jgi:hypothetical protein